MSNDRRNYGKFLVIIYTLFCIRSTTQTFILFVIIVVVIIVAAVIVAVIVINSYYLQISIKT